MRYLFCEIAIVSPHILVSVTGYSRVVFLSSLTFSNYCTGKTEQDVDSTGELAYTMRIIRAVQTGMVKFVMF